MKKLASIIAALTISAASLSAQTGYTPANTADSAGYYIGFTQGAMLGDQVNSNPTIDDKDSYRSDFIRGFTLALLADTVHTGLFDGLTAGASMRNELIKLYSMGLPCNMQLFNDTFVAQFLNPDTTLVSPYMDIVFALINPVQEKQSRQRQLQQERAKQEYLDLAAANVARGTAFIDSIKANVKDIRITPSGLAYRVLKKGSGPNIQPDQQALLYYTGSFVDGTVFDSTQPGDPIKMGPNGVIKGFGEALQLMNKGAKYIFYIPQDLAYGMQAPPAIGPGQTLIFEIEIVDLDTPQN